MLAFDRSRHAFGQSSRLAARVRLALTEIRLILSEDFSPPGEISQARG